jgi:DNA modification methylase
VSAATTSRVLVGDCRQRLADLPERSIHCCVTSPPYWGLRDYGTGQWEGGEAGCDHKGPPKASDRSGLKNDGRPPERVGRNVYEEGATVPYRDRCGKCGAVRVDRQLGLEAVPDCGRLTAPALDVLLRGDLDEAQLAEALDLVARLRPYLAFKEPCGACYVCHLVEVFRAVRRTLRDDGTVWLNLGDSYNTYAANRGNDRSTLEGRKQTAPLVPAGYGLSAKGLKPKDLVGIPWRVALALQADGWYLRSEVIWSKKSCMPESVRDRPTRSHEQVFLLSKKATYFYDAEAVREDYAMTSNSAEGDMLGRTARGQQGMRSGDKGRQRASGAADGQRYGATSMVNAYANGGRNLRSVWTLGPEPFPDAHFAVYPTEIPRRAILAGTSERGCCPECGAGWVRVVERLTVPDDLRNRGNGAKMDFHSRQTGSGQKMQDWYDANPVRTTGWSPSCLCCTICGESGLEPKEIHRHAAQRPSERARIRTGLEDSQAGSGPGLLQAEEGEAAKTRDDVSGVRQGVLGHEDGSLLQPGVFGSRDVAAGDRQPIRADGGEAGSLRDGPEAGSSDGRQAGPSLRASSSDGGSPGPGALAERVRPPQERQPAGQPGREPGDRDNGRAQPAARVTAASLAEHEHTPYPPIPATVLDPFAGAGTTGLVADRLGRSSVLIELNPEYAAMSERRIRKDAPLFNHVEAEATPVAAASARQMALLEVS